MTRDQKLETLRSAIRDVPDFPKPGILFKDITTLLKVPGLLGSAADLLAEPLAGRGIEKVLAVESRGFILGSLVADRLKVGFVPVRKPGKLPAARVRSDYDLEYGSDSVEMHEDAVRSGERVVIVDDVIATGGTALATAGLVQQLGGLLVSYAFLIELTFLNGREKLAPHEVMSLIRY